MHMGDSSLYFITFIVLIMSYFLYKDAKEEYEGLKAMQLYYKITTEYLLGKLDKGHYIKYNDRGNFVYLGRKYVIFGLDNACVDYEGYPIMVVHKRNRELEDSYKGVISDTSPLHFYMFVYRYKADESGELVNYFRIKHMLYGGKHGRVI
nr:MAG TPA: hypothetical protein [Bacteriophage sp.]